MHRFSRLPAAGALVLTLAACSLHPGTDQSPRRDAAAPSADAATRCSTLPDGDRAIYACREAVRSSRANPAMHRALADRLEALGRHTEALRSREEVSKLLPDDPMAALELGQAQELAGKKREALRSYERFAEMLPQEPRAHELVGWMRIEMGQFAKALVAFREAARSPRGSAHAHYGSALALAAMYRREEAIVALQQAVERDSTRAEYWGQLAVNALALARPAEAVAYWNRAVRADVAYFDGRRDERRQWESTRLRLGDAPATVVAVSSAPRADSVRRPTPADSAGPRPRDRGEAAALDPTPRGAHVAVPSNGSSGTGKRREVLVGPDASGSGFMITRSGYLVTNKHVVRACRQVQVRVGESALHPAEVVAVDPDDDLALLKVDAPLPSAVVFRGSPAVRAGEDVVATGYPLSGLLADEVNVTVGTISALAGMRNDKHVLQMTAPVQPGSSGGPLFDASGHLVGVVVTKLNARIVAEETGDIPQNVNFAVKATVLQDFLDGAKIDYRVGSSRVERSNADIGDIGREVTVMVQCFR